MKTLHCRSRLGREWANDRRAACWLLILLLVPSAESFGQTPEQETLQQIRIAIPPVAGGQLSSVTWDGRAWVAVGTRSTILRSGDGSEWAREAANAEVCFRNVTSGNGTLLALTHCSTALLSQSGLPWERWETPGLQIRSAAFGRGVFVGVGDSGAIAVSSNATAWTTTVVGSSASLLCVHYAKEQFVAVGSRGAIVTSTDGREWTSRDSKTDRRLDGVVQGDGLWVAVGSHGAIVSSPEGEHWTPRESGTEESLQAIAFGSGTFLAVGRNGCLLASPDARNWRSLASCGTDLCDVAYGCDRFVAVGQSSTILLVGRNLKGHGGP